MGPHTGEVAREGTRSWNPQKVSRFSAPAKKPAVYAHAVVGKRIRLYWPSEGEWFSGTVYAYDESTDLHSVLYDDDDDYFECLCDPTTAWTLELKRPAL